MEFDLAGTLKATDSVSNQDEEREFNLSETLEATDSVSNQDKKREKARHKNVMQRIEDEKKSVKKYAIAMYVKCVEASNPNPDLRIQDVIMENVTSGRGYIGVRDSSFGGNNLEFVGPRYIKTFENSDLGLKEALIDMNVSWLNEKIDITNPDLKLQEVIIQNVTGGRGFERENNTYSFGGNNLFVRPVFVNDFGDNYLGLQQALFEMDCRDGKINTQNARDIRESFTYLAELPAFLFEGVTEISGFQPVIEGARKQREIEQTARVIKLSREKYGIRDSLPKSPNIISSLEWKMSFPIQEEINFNLKPFYDKTIDTPLNPFYDNSNKNSLFSLEERKNMGERWRA